MINNVAFTGKLLMPKSIETKAQAAKRAAQEAADKLNASFVKPYTVLEPLPERQISTAVYASPFATTGAQQAVVVPAVNRTGLNFFA